MGNDATRIIISPPYLGLPNLSHQFPEAVDVVAGTGAEVIVAEVVVTAGFVVDVADGVEVVFSAQDIKIMESIIMILTASQTTLVFIFPLYFIILNRKSVPVSL